MGYMYCINKSSVDRLILTYLDVILAISLTLSVILLNHLFYVSGLIGVLMAVAMSLALTSRVGDYTVAFSRLTYTIFLLSYMPQMFIRGPIEHWLSLDQYVLSGMSFAFGLILPVAVGLFAAMQRNDRFWKYVKLIIGL